MDQAGCSPASSLRFRANSPWASSWQSSARCSFYSTAGADPEPLIEMIASPSSPGYFSQPTGGDLTYIGDTSIYAPDLTDSFACVACTDGTDSSGGNPANGSSSDGLWSSIGSVLGGIFSGFTARTGPVTVGIGTQPQPRPPIQPTAASNAGMMYLWLAIAAIVLILLLRK